jgi:2-iminobutanoate/2-iminopropanoate deaminase
MKRMKSLIIFLLLALLSHISFSQDNPEIKPIAPYSSAVMTTSGMLFISGQIPIDPETGKLHKGDVQKETKIVMKRIGILLEKYGMDYSHLVKCTVFLADIRDYQAVNKVYASFFEENYPAREAIEVANLPLGASIEISAIASK